MKDLPAILSRGKKNDRNAQGMLYNWLASSLLAVCVRYLKDRAEAEDVMQDTFVKIFTGLHAFKNDGSFEGWARRIAVNTALSRLRQKNRVLFEHNLQLAETPDFAEEEHQDLETADIMACMDALPAGYRLVVNLFLVEEFSHREIAEKLGISESTSRSQYTRARHLLMKLIKTKTEQLATKKN